MATTLLDLAEVRVVAIEQAAQAVTDAIAAENDAIRVRDEHKDALVNALIGNENPITKKPHSATSAAEAAEKDGTYRTLDGLRKRAEAARIIAWAKYEQAKLRAKIAVVAAEGGS